MRYENSKGKSNFKKGIVRELGQAFPQSWNMAWTETVSGTGWISRE
jgi:hypothetical protein